MDERGGFQILRVDANVLQKLLRRADKLVLQLWVGGGTNILTVKFGPVAKFYLNLDRFL